MSRSSPSLRAAWFFAVVLIAACSASGPADDKTSDDSTIAPSSPGSPDAGPSIVVPQSETCGNGSDDDGDGLVDESCGCAPKSGSSDEFPTKDCDPPPEGDAATGCVPESATELACNDGKDDDCDGTIDCGDADCHQTGKCGCAETETQCGDGVDDDCDGVVDCADADCPKCVPGATRYCDEPVYCAWGKQTCGPDGNWGACIEVPAPSGCEGMFFFDNTYDLDCCVAKGYCCQAYPADNSVGNCAGIAVCP